MQNFKENETRCEIVFRELDEVFHIWTPENFQVIFTVDSDFKTGMGIMAIGAKMFPDVRVLTFEVMSNHFHITAAGKRERVVAMVEYIKNLIATFVKKSGRLFDSGSFVPKFRKLETLEDLRNVISYNNRNGFIVNPSHTPFTYPWGANRYFFNPDAKQLALLNSHRMSIKEKRALCHTHSCDKIEGIFCFEGYALPLSFCDIEAGESIFRNASHYFSKISRNIEANAKIAKEIGESIFYNDDELYSVVIKIVREQYKAQNPSLLPAEAKINVAKLIHYEYNASSKQIARILKLSHQQLDSLGL